MKTFTLFSGLLLIGACLLAGCNYYYIRKSENKPSAELKKWIEDTAPTLSRLEPGTQVLVTTKSDRLFVKYFIHRDSSFIYLGETKKKFTQKVPMSELRTISPTRPTRFFIVHINDKAWHFDGIRLNQSGDTVKGYLAVVPVEHQQYKIDHPNPGRSKLYTKGENRIDPTNELHFFVTQLNLGKGQSASFPLSAVRKVEVYERDKGSEFLATGALVTLTATAVVLAVVAAQPPPTPPQPVPHTKSSCPFVYVINDEKDHFIGEAYPGAILPSLERDDYLPLPEMNHTPVIRFTNELEERQHTNYIELLAVSISSQTKVWMDVEGISHTIVSPMAPIEAKAGFKNLLRELTTADNVPYSFDIEEKERSAYSHLQLKFPNPTRALTGKLLLRLKNSDWLDEVYGRFTSGFGSAYSTFHSLQESQPRETMEEFAKEEGIPLRITVKEHEVHATFVPPVGPMAYREVVVPLTWHQPDTLVDIELGCGFHFWDIDYVAIDFTADVPTHVEHLSLTSATDEMGTDVLALLQTSDHIYYDQPTIGNSAILKFDCPATNQKYFYFLHTRGHYEHIRSYNHAPNLFHLGTSMRSGGFAAFARESYRTHRGEALPQLIAIELPSKTFSQP